MSWEQSNSLWVKAQKKRLRLILLGIAMLCIFSIGFLILAFTVASHLSGIFSSDGSSSPLSFLPVFLVSFAIGYPVIIGFFIVRSYRREKQVLKVVPLHDGQFCPDCRRLMDHVEPNESNCKKCNSVWPKDELRQYWEQFVLARKESAVWLAEQRIKHSPKNRIQARLFTFAKAHPVLWPACITSIAGLIYIIYSIIAQTYWATIIIRIITFTPIVLGMILMGNGAKRRRGNTPYCAACDYAKSPAQIEDTTTRCPECNAAWNEPGGTVYGQISQKPVLYYSGIALSIVGFLFIYTNRLGPIAGITANATPTSILIQQLGHSIHPGGAAWDEIDSRQLTEEELSTLANLVMDLRLEYSYFTATDASAWLDNHANSGALTGATLERYYEEMLVLQLTGPQSVGVGEPFTLTLEGMSNPPRSRGMEAKIVVDGFYVDDNTTPVGRRDGWNIALYLDTGFINGDDAYTMPAYTSTFSTPSKHTIKFTAWFVLLRSGTKWTTDPWDENGNFILPLKADYAKRIVITHEIDVIE